jgi:phosphoribosylformylglycinamidine cyclo-ligase
MNVSYKKAGVDVEKAERLVGMLRKKVPGIGGFSGLFPLNGKKGPILAATTDGVGTKLKVAFLLNRHRTVGIDLVAMCANDLIVCGAKPLFFLDYYAMGKLDLKQSKDILAGILEGCRQAGMTLLGGETAEMPGMYPRGEYDLAGFAVGVVEPVDVPKPQELRPGDVLLGLPSTGVHSNGFSLVRKVLGDKGLQRLGPELMTPTKIYVREAAKLRAGLRKSGHKVLAMAHITGGGLVRNLGRILPKHLDASVRPGWKAPSVFAKIAAAGVAEREMFRTFNMGVGLVVAVRPDAARAARRSLPPLMEIGKIVEGNGKVRGIG